MMIKNFKGTRMIVLFIILSIFCFSTSDYVVLADGTGFRDVKDGYWAKDSIERFSHYGIIKGYPDGSFKPDNEIRTNEFIAIVTRIFHMNWNIINELSLDISNDAAKDINWEQNSLDLAKRTGLIKENEFKDYKEPITRAQMARIVSRAICVIENPSLFDGERPEFDNEIYPHFGYDITPYSGNIKDYDKLGEFKELVLSAYAKGVINGYPDGEFKPGRTVTRAEAAAILSRILRKEDRTNFEMQRYIDAYPLKQKMQWQDGITNLKVSFHTSGTMLPEEATLEISREAGLQYKVINLEKNTTIEQFSRKLSEAELKEVFEYIINENYFFALPSDLSTDDLILDGGYSSVTIVVDGKEHSAGGYMAENKYYDNIIDKLFELKERAPSTFKSMQLRQKL